MLILLSTYFTNSTLKRLNDIKSVPVCLIDKFNRLELYILQSSKQVIITFLHHKFIADRLQ